ncbi:MAG: hypothetical protein FWB72_02960 [Firmicutes bacterium]|nr:hypothetical protein [Bacillota bacterium]
MEKYLQLPKTGRVLDNKQAENITGGIKILIPIWLVNFVAGGGSVALATQHHTLKQGAQTAIKNTQVAAFQVNRFAHSILSGRRPEIVERITDALRKVNPTTYTR